MYSPIPNGTKKSIHGLLCNLPSVGHGIHSETGEMAEVEILKRSTNKKEQFWEPQPLPEELDEWKAQEEERQLNNPDYAHPELLKIKQREWHRRLYGVWYYNNGEPVYLTGQHYFYINYWQLDTGLPDYRLIDLEYFYFWMYVTFDPKCYGIVEIQKRRNGKSFRASSILYETISRTKKAKGGIQSKTKDDAQDFFQDKLINQFKALPFFFKPTYDLAKGDTPKAELSFYHTAKKGKNKLQANVQKPKELQSTINFKDRQAKAYDGWKLKVLVLDERGKVDINVLEAHKVVKYCVMDNRRKVIGKIIVTSTVEQIGVKFGFKTLWKQSNQHERTKDGKTISGLYKIFIPAHRSGDYDKYGVPDEKNTLTAILSDRKAYEDNPDELNDLIRKEPLTEDEAFRISSAKCHFNIGKLNDQQDALNIMQNYKERGDFVWEQIDKKIRWSKNAKGRWEICYLFEKLEEACNVIKRGSQFLPGNQLAYVTGVDPVDHDTTEDPTRQSKAAGLTLRRHNPFLEDHPYNKAFVCKYVARPEPASVFYEDMIKQCFYYGSPMLFENNKIRIKEYFTNRGYSNFLIHLPGKSEPGITSTTENKIALLEITQDYVDRHISKVFFPDIITDWMEFNILETQKYDLSMAAGWALVADGYRATRTNSNEQRKLTEYFKQHKVVI